LSAAWREFELYERSLHKASAVVEARELLPTLRSFAVDELRNGQKLVPTARNAGLR
jgi:hypothetical protein